jgi:hypothetical protein
MRKVIILYLLLPVFCMAQAIVDFRTMTEAMEWASTAKLEKRALIKKIIFTDSITGEDYSTASEWYWFRYLDGPFPNLDTVEILTDQSPPYWDSGTYADGGFFTGAAWLKSFSAPNMKYLNGCTLEWCINLEFVYMPALEIISIGDFACCFKLTSIYAPNVTEIGAYAFSNVVNLVSVDMPLVIKIKNNAFEVCNKLTTINFPLVNEIEKFAFKSCYALTSVSFGTGFTEPTEIKFDEYVFHYYLYITPYINLTLGEFVLPKPNLTCKIWYSTNDTTPIPHPEFKGIYVWKSITIEPVGIVEEVEEVENNNIYNLRNNKYILENIEHAELYDMTGRLIRKYNNEYLIDLNDLLNGFYLLKYSTSDNKIKTKKIIKK